MSTLMRGSVGAETNSSFIMFTCGSPTFDHQRCIHMVVEQMTRPRLVHVYLCSSLYQIVCVFDVAAVYLCGCVAIWSLRLFVLGRMDTGGKGLVAACCLCDSLPPVSHLTHMVLPP